MVKKKKCFYLLLLWKLTAMGLFEVPKYRHKEGLDKAMEHRNIDHYKPEQYVWNPS